MDDSKQRIPADFWRDDQDRIVVLAAPLLCEALCLLCQRFSAAEVVAVHGFGNLAAAMAAREESRRRTVVLVVAGDSSCTLIELQKFILEHGSPDVSRRRESTPGRTPTRRAAAAMAAPSTRFIWVMPSAGGSIAALSDRADRYETVLTLTALGVDVQISADDGSDVLRPAIAAAMRGRRFVSPSLLPFRRRRRCLSSPDKEDATPNRPSSDVPAGRSSLSRRQIEIARMAAAGKSNDEIASALFISTPTVKSHLSLIFHILRIHRRGHIAAELSRRDEPEMR